MFIWKKNKSVVLDCFTTDSFAHEYAKIAPAQQYYPDWWKRLDLEYGTGVEDNLSGKEIKSTTIRACRGFTTLFKDSFIIPMWDSVIFAFNRGKGWTWESSYNDDLVSTHGFKQFDGWVDEGNYRHIKLKSPWGFSTKSNINFAFVDPVWNRPNISDYTVLTGAMDFKYQNATNVNILVPVESEYKEFKIMAGDPIVQVLPLTESRIDIRCHIVNQQEFEKNIPGARLQNHFIGHKLYSWKKDFLNKHEERSGSKCPFGLGKK